MTSTMGKFAGQNPPTITMKSPAGTAQCPLLGSLFSSVKVDESFFHLEDRTLSAASISSGARAARLELAAAASSSALPACPSYGSTTPPEKQGWQGPGMEHRGV